jgi:hypothetical protein
MIKRPNPQLTVVWDTCGQPDEADLLLVFDMLFPQTPASLTKPSDELSLKHPQDT